MNKLPKDLASIIDALKKATDDGASPEEVLAKAKALIKGDDK
tara:strand:+ start:29 stop:154 length:126 start_codon:yes stop_codon:yes gene_type:complete